MKVALRLGLFICFTLSINSFGTVAPAGDLCSKWTWSSEAKALTNSNFDFRFYSDSAGKRSADFAPIPKAAYSLVCSLALPRREHNVAQFCVEGNVDASLSYLKALSEVMRNRDTVSEFSFVNSSQDGVIFKVSSRRLLGYYRVVAVAAGSQTNEGDSIRRIPVDPNQQLPCTPDGDTCRPDNVYADYSPAVTQQVLIPSCSFPFPAKPLWH